MTALVKSPAALSEALESSALAGTDRGAGGPEVLRPRSTIIVTSDGTNGSDGAIRMALGMVDRADTELEVLTVVGGGQGEGPDELLPEQGDDTARRREQRDAVEVQVARVSGGSHVHPVTVINGSAARTIARVAAERHATLVIVGLGRHDLTDRLCGTETAIQLARVSRVPILAVREDAVALTSRALVAVDFSEHSERAAQAAIDLMGGTGLVELVHVTPYVAEYPSSVQGHEPYKRWARGQLDALIGRLVAAPGVTLTRIILRGRTAQALLARARAVGADLIAVGTHGRGFAARALLGSVTTDLLRGAHCAVLVVPSDPLSLSTPPGGERAVSALRPARAD
ncbi:MAG: universal stress protein [Gemmatimonadaceae bacterium]